MRPLTNLIGPLPRDSVDIEVADLRRIYFRNKEFLSPQVISVRNAVYNGTTGARSENHRTQKAVVSLYCEQLLQLPETKFETLLPSSDHEVKK